MPGESSGRREYHCPGKGAYPAVELGVEKISEPSETKPYRGGDGDKVGKLPEAESISLHEDEPSNHHAYQASVKGHSSFPDREYLERVVEIEREIVSDTVTDTGSHYQAEHQIQEEVIEDVGVNTEFFFLDLIPYQEVRGHEAEDVHDAVPAYVKRTDGDYGWIEVWITQH